MARRRKHNKHLHPDDFDNVLRNHVSHRVRKHLARCAACVSHLEHLRVQRTPHVTLNGRNRPISTLSLVELTGLIEADNTARNNAIILLSNLLLFIFFILLLRMMFQELEYIALVIFVLAAARAWQIARSQQVLSPTQRAWVGLRYSLLTHSS